MIIVSRELLEQSQRNVRGIPLAPAHHLIIFEVRGRGHTLVQTCGGSGSHDNAGCQSPIPPSS